MLPADFKDIIEGLVMIYGPSIPDDVWEGMGIDVLEVAESPDFISIIASLGEEEDSDCFESEEPVKKSSPRLRGAARIDSGFCNLELDMSAFDDGSVIDIDDDEEYEDEDDEDVISEGVPHTTTTVSNEKVYATRIDGEKRVHIYI